MRTLPLPLTRYAHPLALGAHHPLRHRLGAVIEIAEIAHLDLAGDLRAAFEVPARRSA